MEKLNIVWSVSTELKLDWQYIAVYLGLGPLYTDAQWT